MKQVLISFLPLRQPNEPLVGSYEPRLAGQLEIFDLWPGDRSVAFGDVPIHAHAVVIVVATDQAESARAVPSSLHLGKPRGSIGCVPVL